MQGLVCTAQNTPHQQGVLQADLRDVSKALDDEVQGLVCTAHSAQDEDLLPHQASGCAHLQGCLQRIPLAADQE